MVKRPKISFVVGLRNPEYGRKNDMNNLYRTRLFVENITFLCNKYRLLSELVFVEWNSVKEGEFINKIRWPERSDFISIRWIEVPSKIHKQYPNSKKIPIYEFFAKNVGIRRAFGEYILSTNVDVLFSEALIKYLAKAKLSPDFFYRVNRLDIAGYISRKMSIRQRLKYCSDHIIKIHTFYGSVTPEEIAFKNPILSFFRKRDLIKKYWTGEGIVAYPDGFHRNTAGDFFLMAKKRWYQLHGYAELPTHSHIDSIMCWQAATLNLKQVILNERHKLYHIDHDRKVPKLYPKTNWIIWYEKFKKYQLEKKVLMINDNDWGLAQENLKELKLSC